MCEQSSYISIVYIQSGNTVHDMYELLFTCTCTIIPGCTLKRGRHNYSVFFY